MRQVPVRELNQHTADVLSRVERGERIEITRSGTPIAVIEPSRPHPLRQLIESGELRPASDPLPLLDPSADIAQDAAGADAVSVDRGGDRW